MKTFGVRLPVALLNENRIELDIRTAELHLDDGKL